MEWQAYLREPGDTIEMPVAWMDETGLQRTVRIVVELMNQDAPRLIGIKVANRPVYLASSDIVFHAASPETPAPRRIIAANNASAEIVDELPERPPEFLKSCPFCGSADVELLERYGFMVRCGTCGGRGGGGLTATDATAEWNRRPS